MIMTDLVIAVVHCILVSLFLFFESLQAQRRARIHELRLEKGAEKAAEELKKRTSFFLTVTPG